MSTPHLFDIPARVPVPLAAADGNILRRCRYTADPGAYVDMLDTVSPSRLDLPSRVLDALERYVYNEVGPLYPMYNDVGQRDHFLPHAGLWAPTRLFDDPRVMTQLWLHTATHMWYGWPIPVSTTYQRYQRAAHEGELLAVMESEYHFFAENAEGTRGMFNPAYPSTYEAIRAVDQGGTPEQALQFLQSVQHTGELPPEVLHHPAYTGGVAVTLQRQAAWPEHDTRYSEMHWNMQRRAGYMRAHSMLWSLDRQKTIFIRHAEGRAGILRYWREPRGLEPLNGARALAKSMLRVMALDVVQHDVDQDYAFGRIVAIYTEVIHSSDLGRLHHIIHVLPDIYDVILGRDAVQFPAPIWDLATEFRSFRVAWEAKLKEKTEIWTALRA